jgi:hypothetical protein
MTPNKTVIFIEALEHKADSMGWSKGTKQITKFTNQDGIDINISRTMAKSTWPPSKLRAKDSARQERLTPQLEPDKTTR